MGENVMPLLPGPGVGFLPHRLPRRDVIDYPNSIPTTILPGSVAPSHLPKTLTIPEAREPPPIIHGKIMVRFKRQAVIGLIAIAELVSHHPTANIEMAMHHMTRGAYAGQWWVGGQLFGIALPIAAGIAFLAGGLPLWVAAFAGVSAWAGIWFADDAMVKAGQSVPIS